MTDTKTIVSRETPIQAVIKERHLKYRALADRSFPTTNAKDRRAAIQKFHRIAHGQQLPDVEEARAILAALQWATGNPFLALADLWPAKQGGEA